MRLFVPPLKTVLRLASPWSFDLHHEHRNKKLFAALGLKFIDMQEWRAIEYERTGDRYLGVRTLPPPERVRLPRGTVLVVDRIYIRNGAEDFDSITFRVAECSKLKGKPRFWAKLADCNRMNVVVVEEEESSK